MTLADCTPGDIVVMIEDGGEVFVELGSLNGAPRDKKKGRYEYALVTTYRPDEHRYDIYSWRIVDPESEVVEIFESNDRRRRMRDMTRRTPAIFNDGGTVEDPMSMRKGGTF